MRVVKALWDRAWGPKLILHSALTLPPTATTCDNGTFLTLYMNVAIPSWKVTVLPVF